MIFRISFMNLRKLSVLLFLLVLIQPGLFAQEKRIVYARTSNSPPFKAALEGFSEYLDSKNINFRLIEYNLEGSNTPDVHKADVVFSMGTKPTQVMLSKYS